MTVAATAQRRVPVCEQCVPDFLLSNTIATTYHAESRDARNADSRAPRRLFGCVTKLGVFILKGESNAAIETSEFRASTAAFFTQLRADERNRVAPVRVTVLQQSARLEKIGHARRQARQNDRRLHHQNSLRCPGSGCAAVDGRPIVEFIAAGLTNSLEPYENLPTIGAAIDFADLLGQWRRLRPRR